MSHGAKQISLKQAVGEIKYLCDDESESYPFFFLTGAGISNPPVPLASKIIADCQNQAKKHGLTDPYEQQDPMSQYSHWLEQAYPNPTQRKKYFQSLIREKAISRANFRLAHLLLGEVQNDRSAPRRVTNLVVTVNFDDFLSKALVIFGKPHVVCDHPSTSMRIELDDKNELFLIHVHGTHSFYDIKNLTSEIQERAATSNLSSNTMAGLLDTTLRNRSPLVVGYGGWEQDVVMQALKKRMNDGPLRNNLYWFCYERAVIETLPSFLHQNSYVRFVVPDEAKSEPTKQASFGTEQKVEAELLKQYPGGSITPKLDAYAVFDAFNRAFAFSSPYITREPLKFLETQLKASFPAEDIRGEGGDIYSLGAVIRNIQKADALLAKVLQEEGDFKKAFENMREAIRGSRYQDALAVAKGFDWATIPLHQQDQEELCEMFIDIARGSLDDWEGALFASDAATKIFNNTRVATAGLTANASRALLIKAVVLGQLNRSKEAIEVYDEVVARFGEAPEPALREQVATALVYKGVTLGQLNRSEDEITVYDEVVTRFGEASETALREQAAKALVYKGITLGQLNRSEDEITVYDEVMTRFGEASEAALREQAAKALVNKGVRLGQLNRSEDAIAVYDEVVTRFGEASEAALREQAAKALVNKGIRLGQLNRSEDEITVYDEVVTRFGEASEPALREQAAKALVYKGITLGQLNRSEDEIAVYDEVVTRFGEAIRAGVGRASGQGISSTKASRWASSIAAEMPLRCTTRW